MAIFGQKNPGIGQKIMKWTTINQVLTSKNGTVSGWQVAPSNGVNRRFAELHHAIRYARSYPYPITLCAVAAKHLRSVANGR